MQSHLDDVAFVVVLVDLFARERAAGFEEVCVVNAVALLVVGRGFEHGARPLDGPSVLDRNLRRLGLHAAHGPGEPVLLAVAGRDDERVREAET